MLSVCGGRGLRPDPPSPTGVNLLLLLNSFYKVLTVEHTSSDHSTQVFIIRHNGIRQIKQGWIEAPRKQLHVCEAKGTEKWCSLLGM